MKLLEGAAEWARRRRKSWKPQKIFVEVFLSGRPLSIWRGVPVDISGSADSDEGNQCSRLIVISVPGWCDQSSERSDAGFCIL